MKHNRTTVAILTLAAAMTWLIPDSRADIVDFGDNKVPTRTLEFVEDRDLGGRTARFDGVVSERGQRLVVKGLDVMSPLVIRVLAKDASMPVEVSLHRYYWGKANAEGSTGSDGDWAFQGRAYDELGIALAVPETTPVYALIWQGPPVPAAPVPVVISDAVRDSGSSGTSGSESGGVNLMTLGIIGLLAVIAILLALQLIQRRSSAAATILAVLLMGYVATDGQAFAQSENDAPPNPFVDEAGEPATQDQPPNPFADDQKSQGEDYKPEDAGPKPEDTTSAGDSKVKPTPDGDKPDTADSKIKPTPDGDKPGTADSKIKPTPDGDKPGTADSKIKPTPDGDKPGTADSKVKPTPDGGKPGTDETATADSDIKPGSTGSDDPTSSGDAGPGGDRPFDERLESVYAEIRQLRGEIASNAARISNLEFLITQDRGAVPEPGDGAPPMTVSCDNDPACQACLAEANDELSELLVNLDKMRIIYTNYMRYRDYMVGLGDAISGFHQLEQAAWYQTKLQIEEATIGLQGAYDAKFDEFKGTLSSALATLSACNSVEGDPVFSRESVLFENYVKAKYARDE